jgi:cytochrome bd ubiquinol oxidase subunit II
MSQHTLATLSASLILVALITYTVLGGADFGGGIWDLIAAGPLTDRERSAVAKAMGPVWESNHVWLIYVIVLSWTAFPLLYAGVSTALFIPISLALVGIVLRGAAFSFRSNYGAQVGAGVGWGHVFSWASVATPFLLGTVVGGLAGGGIHASGPPVQVQANVWTTWVNPFALSCGAFAVALCALLSATYLTVELQNSGESDLVNVFRRRSLWSGVATVVFAVLAAIFAYFDAPILWNGLTGRALPLVILSVLIGIAAAVVVWRGFYMAARLLVIAETACIFVTWGVAQWPYLIVPDVTVDNAASPASVLGPMLIISLLGLAVLIPSLWYLFYVFKHRAASAGVAVGSHVTTAAFVASLQPARRAGSPAGGTAPAPSVVLLSRAAPGAGRAGQPGSSGPAITTVLVAAVALAMTAIPGLLQARRERRLRQEQERGRIPAQQ